MTPLVGLQSLVALAMAFALQLPRLDVWLATYVMNPWTILPILGFEHWLGRRILRLPPGGGVIGWSHLLRKCTRDHAHDQYHGHEDGQSEQACTYHSHALAPQVAWRRFGRAFV